MRDGATRVNIMREVESSPNGCKTITSILQVHGWDHNRLLEETVPTLDDVVRQGKAFALYPGSPTTCHGRRPPR